MSVVDSAIRFLVYEKNFFRSKGIVGLKNLHLAAEPAVHGKILKEAEAKFGDASKLSNAERSLAQFFCQESLYDSRLQKLVATLLFAILLPFVIVYILFKSRSRVHLEKADVVTFDYADQEYIKFDFCNSKIVTPSMKEVGYYLGYDECVFLFRLFFKNPKIFCFPKLLVNLLRWLSRYSWLIKKYCPHAIANAFEGTASSSILTEYLNLRGIRHLNYAHGEHFRYDCYSAYANFDRYTIWGNHFKEIQIEKNCRPDMFVVRAPEKFNRYFYGSRLVERERHVVTVLIHSGVFRGSIEYEALSKVLGSLPLTWEIRLRPHPLDRDSWPEVKVHLESDLKLSGVARELFSFPPEDQSMRDAIESSRVFMGSASAALLEALLGGCKIIYIPGRVKNDDIFYRHQGSKNVLSMLQGFDSERFERFLAEPYCRESSEVEKVGHLFKLHKEI